MASNKPTKICPKCGTSNEASNTRCVLCRRALIGVPLLSSQGSSHIPKPSKKWKTKKISFSSTVSTGTPLRKWLTLIVVGFVIFLVAASIIKFNVLHNSNTSHNGGDGKKVPTASSHPTVSATPTPSPLALGEFKVSNGEILGINDGSFAPLLIGKDAQEVALKQQAADQLKQKHSDQAIALWQEAIKKESNDPEALIYLEDQRVFLTGLPYVTLVAGVDLANTYDFSDLQGIYVSQHEFNADKQKHRFQIRILIANSGKNTANVPAIAQRIVQLAAQDKTVVGVISWLTSTENLGALPILSKAHIPIISPAASSDALTDASQYFFRVVPPNIVQGKAGALFAEKTLGAKRVVVFIDKNDTYSQNLAQDFESQFINDGNLVVKEEFFTTDNTSQIGTLIQDALTANPDLLYFTSRDTPDSENFQDALPPSDRFPHLHVLAGDAGYVIHKSGYGRWFFIAFAFADEWMNIMGKDQPRFYQEYSEDLNPDGIKPPGYYGYTRPLDISMLSYDVTSVFEDALQIAITSGTVTVTPNGLKGLTPDVMDTALSQINGAQAWQGVSGWISFDTHGNPVNKAIVILSASLDGHTQMNDWERCFAKNTCHNVS